MTPDIRTAIQSMWKAAQIPLINLYDRWLDEREYEDIKEYRAAFEKWLTKYHPDIVMVKFHKRPFGCTVYHKDAPHSHFTIKCTTRHYSLMHTLVG